MDVKSVLDEKFPTFEALKKNLEHEQGQVKERNKQIEDEIEAEKQAALSKRGEASANLQRYFKSIDKSVMERVPSDRDFNECVKGVASSQQKREIQQRFKRLQQLTKGHQVVIRLQRIRSQEQELAKVMGDTDKAMEVYNTMLEDERGLIVFSKSSNPAVAALASKGVEHFEKTIRAPLQESCKQDLRELLKQHHWPKLLPKYDEFVPLFIKLLTTEKQLDHSPSKPEPLAAFAVLAEQYHLRFKYHFEGNKETNRLDKPEWAFEHFKTTIDEQTRFMEECVQPALAQVDKFADRNALNEFITAMLPPVYGMLKRVFPQVLNSPKLLSHLVYQTGLFDQMLQGSEAGFYYLPYGREEWRGLTGDILAKSDYFDQWLSIERGNALSRFQEIIDSPSAFEIDEESVDFGENKPTHSAINLKDLLEGVTDHYKSLTSVSYRLQFLSEIQITLLDKYFDRLQESIAAFDSMSSSLARSIGGVSAEDRKRVSGAAGLERLCRIYGSAEFLRAALDSWSQELFFLTLWDDICRLSAKNKKLDSKAKHAVEETPVHMPDSGDDEGTLFDETIASFEKIKARVFVMIQTLMKQELRSNMSDYFSNPDWRHVDQPPAEVSSKLAHPIKVLGKQLEMMRRLQSTNDFRRFTKSFAADLERYMWNRVIQANTFSKFGAQQLAKDVAEVWNAFQLPRDASFRRLEQACILLCTENLPHNAAKIEQEFNLPDLSTQQILQIIDRRL